MATAEPTPFRKLMLPKRYEILERRATESSIQLDNIVVRVDEPSRRIETLLRQIRDGGVGRFELFLGLSGSGKTTFVKTLPLFFRDVIVTEVPAKLDLSNVGEYISSRYIDSGNHGIFLMLDRDNNQVDADKAKSFFESMRVLFRQVSGQVLVIYPITDDAEAKKLASVAMAVGRDSVIDITVGGVYDFKGLSRDRYYDVADTTARTFSGAGLESFGLTREETKEDLSKSETISQFYSLLEDKSADLNKYSKRK